ncbi:MAG: LysM peptidoglycan-binding domain-containing M23 family metallopeptidase [Deltaproteobacteria bacterium]|nr:LysM peptidoglycan-binding domain-containing M23 family metallopeptidase [Deltaproteobacteria bacterium]
MRTLSPISAVLVALALGALGGAIGCEEEPPPPVEAAPDPEPEAEPEPEPEPFVEHTVTEGQTLWDISRAYDVSVDAIMEENEMRPRDVRRMSKGMVLRIPGATAPAEVTRRELPTLEDLPELEDGAYHMLAEGQTLWDLAATYDLTISELMDRNEFDDEAVRLLRPGQPVIIPGIDQDDIKEPEPRERAANGHRHEVQRGETIWDLARSFRVSVSQLMAANGLDQEGAANLREGARLWVPAGRRGTGEERALTPKQRRAQSRARNLGLGTREAASKLLRGQVERRWIVAGRGNPNRLPGTLRWPVSNGRFVRGFGSGEGGYHLAVDIAGDMGWNVRSAAAGIVGYSGDGVPGYGNMVLVIHTGGMITMYAHNSVNFVVAGERVPAGAVLAELGSTGISRGPHVHFEMMYDGNNCDPATLFRPGVRHRSRLARIEREVWRTPDRRPEGVTCHRRRRHPRSRWVVNE